MAATLLRDYFTDSHGCLMAQCHVCGRKETHASFMGRRAGRPTCHVCQNRRPEA